MLSNFEGIIIDVNVKRVKTIRLYISRNGQAKLSVPISCPKEEVMDFLHKNKEWLIGALERSKARIQKENQKTQHAMEQGEVFYYLGKKYVLHVEEHKQVKEISVRIEGENLVIETPNDYNADEICNAVNKWYYKEIKALITHYVDKWIPLMNEKPLRAIQYKLWKSKWGTMMPTARIATFNIRLIFYPKEAIESVVVHELCHLKEPSHNVLFHALMAHYLPDYKTRELALKNK